MKKLLKYLCPHTWFKKREITFYGERSYWDILNPIIKSSQVKREWIKRAKYDFDRKLLEKNQIYTTSSHRCLGIRELFEKGFVVKTHCEFAVETNGNDDDIKIHCGNSIIGLREQIHNESSTFAEDFGFFKSDLMGNYTSPLGAIKHIIKMETAWHIDLPKDMSILILPFNYSDDNRFMATTGIFNPLYTTQLSIPLWWFSKNSYEIVRKGTPIAQLIPIHNDSEKYNWKMKDEVPYHIRKKVDGIILQKKQTKCPFYSDFKVFGGKIFDQK
jgi:hypothetical protein